MGATPVVHENELPENDETSPNIKPLPPLVVSRDNPPQPQLQLQLKPQLKPQPQAQPQSSLPAAASLGGSNIQAEPESPLIENPLASQVMPENPPSSLAHPTPVHPTLIHPTPPRSSSAKKRAQKRRRRARTSTKRLFLIALRDVFIALGLLTILLQFFSPTVVREHSMEDTLKENEILYIARKAYWFGSPQYGDIVVFHTALTDENGSEKSLVKRIVGLPGDHITVSEGMVIRNGTPLDEPYLKS
jgi:signal peptidase I